MLFIYGKLTVGGIETFFVRMARERANLGLTTSILLLSKPESSDSELLISMRKYAQVTFVENLFVLKFIGEKIPLLAPVKKSVLKKMFNGIDQIHVYDGMHALLGERLARRLNIKIPITIGFYHYIKYLWGGSDVAYYEKINRKFVFDYLPEQSLLFFSEGSRELYIKHKKKCFDKSNTFRLGVVDKKDVQVSGQLRQPLKIVAIGRLVEFKTYNLFMVDVILNLKKIGIETQFDIYGDGDLKNEIKAKIEKYNLKSNISLKGTLDYSKFDSTLLEYDLFIGSGTAIIQAASLGLPSIIGIENMLSAKTYGYFSAVHNLHYHRKGLDLPLISVENVILEFINMSEVSRYKLRQEHVDCIDNFTNQACQKHMDELRSINMPIDDFKYNSMLYMISRILDRLIMRYNKNHPRRTQFKDFRDLDEK